MLLHFSLALLMVLARSGWMMSGVLELRSDSSIVLLMHWVATTVDTLKMLESGALERLHALKEPSDFKGALPPMDVWKSATTMSGGRFVMICGVPVMPKLPADS